MWRLFMKCGFLLIVSGLLSCSASQHLRIARRLDPSLFQADTLIIRDTITYEIPTVSELVRYDTIVQIIQTDPITQKEYIVRYEIRHDSIFIDCPDVEIIYEEKIVTNTVTLKPSFRDQIKYGVILVVTFGGVLGLYKFIRIFI